MATRPASPWSRAARTMRQHVDAAMNHMADVIKDALLDGLEPGDEDDDVPVAPLTPLVPDEFVRRMRGPTERALRQVAEVLNAAPYAAPAAIDEATGELFTELWLEALQVAAQMRLDADLAGKPPDVEPPQGEWARRYRRMHADDPH
jgi:hypothetical protein